MKKKLIIMITALVLLFSVAVIGTIAWLLDTTDPVVNTFSPSTIDITLTETNGDGEIVLANTYKMLPGTTIDKDPKVTVKSGSEACWLFIKVEKTNAPDTYLNYTIDTANWAPLDGNDGVYYYKGTDLDELLTADKTYSILTDDKVTVKETVTKDMMTALKTSGNYPKLTFTAYAIQKANVADAAKAWDEIN